MNKTVVNTVISTGIAGVLTCAGLYILTVPGIHSRLGVIEDTLNRYNVVTIKERLDVMDIAANQLKNELANQRIAQNILATERAQAQAITLQSLRELMKGQSVAPASTQQGE